MTHPPLTGFSGALCFSPAVYWLYFLCLFSFTPERSKVAPHQILLALLRHGLQIQLSL